MIRGYLVAALMLTMGLAGVAAIATQASRSLSADRPTKSVAKAEKIQPEPAGMSSTSAQRPDAGAPVQTSAADAGVAKAVPQDADAAAPRPKSTPDAAVPAADPPRHSGPAPVLVVEFEASSSSPSRQGRRAIRRLIREHGYKGVHYLLTGYAAEMQNPKRNRNLAKRRCRKVARLIRKRGVSRRWFRCGDPVYRQQEGEATAAHKAPAWRKVVVRLEKR
ncbi:MAG: hypothetical protein ABI333_01265 [bacterium]